MATPSLGPGRVLHFGLETGQLFPRLAGVALHGGTGVMIPQRIEPVFTERYESGESVLSAQVNSVKGVYLRRRQEILLFAPRVLHDIALTEATDYWARALNLATMENGRPH